MAAKTSKKPKKSKKQGKAAASAASQPRRKPARGGAATSPRPMWSGNIRLALVSVPVKIYPATRTGARISFHQVHEPSGKRIRYQKIVPGIGPVDTDEIVKGFEIDRDRYVLIDPEEVDALKIEAKKTLDLVQFVSQGEIDPIWFDRPYYVVADGDLAEEAYNVLREALRSGKRLGLGQFVMRGREYVAALKPCGSGLLLETLRFADEVREAAPFFAEMDDDRPDSELLALAGELIERKTAAFDPSVFHDRYTEALRELIEERRRRKTPVEIGEAEEEPGGGAEIIDLVDALKKSVRGAKGGSSSSGGGSKKRRKAG